MGRLEIPQGTPADHRCKPPGPVVPPRWAQHPSGSRWYCDCGQVWIVRFVPTKVLGTQAEVSHLEWFRESWRERRRRLRGHDRLITPKPAQPPRGPSGISPSSGGVR